MNAPVHVNTQPRVNALAFEAVAPRRGGRSLFAPLSASLEPGTFLGIVGPNGSGKSSLLSVVARTGVRATGTVRYGGRDVARMRSRERAEILALMTQDSYAPNELRVLDIVRVGALAGAAAGKGSATDRSHDALEQLGIHDLAARAYSTLSGGQRQLVQLARVLAQNSPVMLFDEPTSALDLHHHLTVMHALHERALAGHIVLITMHDLSQALRWSNRIAVIAEQVRLGAPSEVLTPATIREVYGVETESFLSPSGAPTLGLVRPEGWPDVTQLRTARKTASRPAVLRQ